MTAESQRDVSTGRSKTVTKVAVVVLLLAAVAGAIYFKESGDEASVGSAAGEASVLSGENPQTQLPRLVDLGAGKCIPCKMMAPILDELKKDFEGKFDVVVIDVWKDRSAGKEYRVRVIPTQIFYDAGGNELYRHEGFFSKEDILKTWKKHGVELDDEMPKRIGMG